jgi:hypothetical protein
LLVDSDLVLELRGVSNSTLWTILILSWKRKMA